MNKTQRSIKQLLRENFECYRAQDVVVVTKIRRSSGISEEDIVNLLIWWRSSENPEISLLDFLIANKIFTKDARTSLEGKKISKYRDLNDFLNRKKLEQIKSQIASGEINKLLEPKTSTKVDSKLTSENTAMNATVAKVSRVSANALPRVGMRLGKCLLTEVIGKGTSSIVYKGHHETLQIPVAIKVFLPQSSSHAEALRKQFGAEAQTLAKLNHRSIVRILDFEDGQHPYLILEYVDGKSLDELIREHGRVDYQRAAYYIYCVAGGLLTAHGSGIIHRDIKPANILLTRDDTAKLADLGIAHITCSKPWKDKDIDEGKSTTSLPGTPAYIAPELAFTQNYGDARSDIYSLGATFYRAVTGRYPFEGESAYMVIMKHVHEPLVPAHEVAEGVPGELSNLIQKMMAKKPEDRFQSVEDILPDLLTLFLGSGLYSVNEDLTPMNTGSGEPIIGTRTRVLINAARKVMEASRSREQTTKDTPSKD